MNYHAHVALVTLVLGAVALGCKSNESAPKPPVAAASASASRAASASASARTPRPTNPPPKPDLFTVRTSDGVRISASEWSSGDPSAPTVILVHRLAGSIDEWSPLLERLFPTKHPMNVVAFDLRGHGGSKKAKEEIAWQSFKTADFQAMDRDLAAVTAHLAERKGGPPRWWVLVGSDLGATLAVRHADDLDNLAALALVSPGASLRGMNIYKPFAAVLDRPNLIIAGLQDNVSSLPAKSMSLMSKTSKLVTFPAREHSAQYLGKERWEMWDELADWIDARVATKPTVAVSSASPPAASAPAGAASGQ